MSFLLSIYDKVNFDFAKNVGLGSPNFDDPFVDKCVTSADFKNDEILILGIIIAIWKSYKNLIIMSPVEKTLLKNGDMCVIRLANANRNENEEEW